MINFFFFCESFESNFIILVGDYKYFSRMMYSYCGYKCVIEISVLDFFFYHYKKKDIYIHIIIYGFRFVYNETVTCRYFIRLPLISSSITNRHQAILRCFFFSSNCSSEAFSLHLCISVRIKFF